MKAKAISGPVDECVVVKLELPFMVNDPVALILNLYGETICIFFFPFFDKVLIVFGRFWNDDSSKNTIISF